jgi:hypothetical protein
MNNSYFYLNQELEAMGLSPEATIAAIKSSKKVAGTDIRTKEDFSITAENTPYSFFVDILYPQRSGNSKLPLRKHYQNGVLISEEYGKIIKGKTFTHRDGDKPAIIVYEKEDGKFYTHQESFYKEGKEYREGNKPEFLMYHKNGNILCKRKGRLLKVYTINGLFIEKHISKKIVFSLYHTYSFLLELGFEEFKIV